MYIILIEKIIGIALLTAVLSKRLECSLNETFFLSVGMSLLIF